MRIVSRQIGRKKCGKLKFPVSPSFCPFSNFFYLFLIFKFCHERRIRASGLIYKSVVIPLVQPNEEQKIRKPVWTVSCKFLFFNRCEIASSGNWNRISLNMMNDLLPLGYFFWCAQYRFQTTLNVHVNSFIRREEARRKNKNKPVCLAIYLYFFFRGNQIYFWMGGCGYTGTANVCKFSFK